MNFANKVTVFRIVSIPFFVACILYYTTERDFLRFIALAIFLLAVVSDTIDGYIARIRKQETKIGSILDPLADKLLLSFTFLLLFFIKDLPQGIKPPLWLVLIVVSRDIIIILGAAIIFVVKKDIEIIPTKWGKYATFFQMATVVLVLLQWQGAVIFWRICGILTIVSGLDYLIKGVKILGAVDRLGSNN